MRSHLKGGRVKRGGPLKRTPMKPRSASLKRASKPIARTSRLKARRTPKRYADRRVPAFLDWLRTLACVMAGHPGHVCEGGIQACHLVPKGRGAPDLDNAVPGCAIRFHLTQEKRTDAYNAEHGVDLWARARGYTDRWLHETGQTVADFTPAQLELYTARTAEAA